MDGVAEHYALHANAAWNYAQRHIVMQQTLPRHAHDGSGEGDTIRALPAIANAPGGCGPRICAGTRMMRALGIFASGRWPSG